MSLRHEVQSTAARGEICQEVIFPVRTYACGFTERREEKKINKRGMERGKERRKIMPGMFFISCAGKYLP